MAELNAVLADGYDREAFARALGRREALRAAAGRLASLLPHPEPLLCDLFCALFKLNVVLRPAKALSPSVLINRSVLEAVSQSEHLPALRRSTELDAARAATATALLAEQVLRALRREFRQRPEELLHALESARDEELLEQRRSERDTLERSEAFDAAQKKALAAELDEEIAALEAKGARDRRRQRAASRSAAGIGEAIDAEMETLSERLGAAEGHARGLGLGSGTGGVDAERRLELGDRIMRSQKLRLLARLVGALREAAFEARRRRVARSPQELHAVTLGAELERLLPAELLGLRRRDRGEIGRGLHVDFLRRFSERQLLEYRLDAAAERGPMVVCVDGSGSMQGSKELWGKAVALTLMEIARREHRACLAIVFSSGEPLFEVELLDKAKGGARRSVRDEEVLRFAEHFPGGGTDFEPPLERALAAVTAGSYRRGDVVFITDGHAPVSDGLLQRIARERKRHRFRIRAILVDVGDHERRTVERFAHDVRAVTDLAADTLADLFASV